MWESVRRCNLTILELSVVLLPATACHLPGDLPPCSPTTRNSIAAHYSLSSLYCAHILIPILTAAAPDCTDQSDPPPSLIAARARARPHLPKPIRSPIHSLSPFISDVVQGQALQAPRFITPPSASGSVVAEGRTKILQCQALGE